MKYFYLDTLQKKVYCFHPSVKKDMDEMRQQYLTDHVIRISKEEAKRAFKEKKYRFSFAAMEELNLPCSAVRISMEHSNIVGTPLQSV